MKFPAMRDRKILIGGVAVTLLLVGAVQAQTTGETGAVDAAPAAATAPAKAIPALLTANADHGLLLGIARAGERIVAVGGNGVILRSNEGRSWQQVASPIDSALNAVAFADSEHGWAVGHDAVILATSNGGANWAVQNFQPELFAPIFAVLPIDAQTAFAVGAFGMIKATADGGAHWGTVSTPISDEKLHFNAIARLNSGKLVVAGEQGMVGVSSDGLQWARLATPYEGSFFGILPWGPRGALVFGMRGNVYGISDVETGSWQKIETGTTNSFFGGEALADGRALLTGAEGSVMVINRNGSANPAPDVKSGTSEASAVLLSIRMLGGAAKDVTSGATDGSLTGSLVVRDSLIVIGEAGVRQLGVQQLPKL